eukprot:4329261-Pyramimonas_sp.AAC.1
MSKGKPITFSAQQVRIAWAAPPLLACRIDAPGVNLNALVAHAPHSANSAAEKLSFWEDLDAVGNKWPPQLCFMGGNCHLAGDEGCEVAGTKGPDGSSSAGSARLKKWLHDHKL